MSFCGSPMEKRTFPEVAAGVVTCWKQENKLPKKLLLLLVSALITVQQFSGSEECALHSIILHCRRAQHNFSLLYY